MSVKEVVDSLARDRKALIDAFRQLHFLSQRQREIVLRSQAKGIDNYIKDKSEELGLIDKISAEIKKKINFIKSEGAASDKEYAEDFVSGLQKECRGIIDKIVAIETADRDFILKTKGSLGNEMKEIDATRGKLKKLKISYGTNAAVKFFDEQG